MNDDPRLSPGAIRAALADAGPMAWRNIRSTDHALAEYHGSVGNEHGTVVRVGDCRCPRCATEPTGARAVLVTRHGGVLWHVRVASYRLHTPA